MHFFLIVLVTVAAAMLYGIVHDQITIRVCLEYFTITHPPILATSSPTLLALAWGAFTTWTAGIPFGFLVASAARNGRRHPPLTLRCVFPWLGWLLLGMAASATAAGFLGFFLAQSGLLSVPGQFVSALPEGVHNRFMAVSWAHMASYATGIVGGLFVALKLYRNRTQLRA